MLANSIFQANKAADILRLLCAASLLIMLIIGITVYGAPAGQLLVLAFFFLIYVQLPGLLAAKWAGLDGDHVSVYIASGIFAGWALCVLGYFIAEFTGIRVLLLIEGPLLSLVYICLTAVRSVKSADPDVPHLRRINAGVKQAFLRDRFSFGRLSPAFCLFFVLALLYCLVNTQYRYLAPDLADFTNVNPDKAYHMGLINSLSHGYPLQSMWTHGHYIRYHIFSEILLSIPVRLFGVRADVCTQSFAPLMNAYSFGITYYAFFREMMSKPDRAGLYCLFVMLSNLFIIRKWDSSLGFKFLLTNDNSAGYGTAAALVLIIVFKKWYEKFTEESPERHRLLILCAALIMLVTGIKGPVGAVCIAGLWGTVLLGIVLRKLPLKTLLPLLVMTAGFLLVYITVLGAKGQVGSSGGATIALGEMANIAFWKKPLVRLLKAAGLPAAVRLPVVMVVFMVFYLTVFFVPFCTGYIRELILVLSGRRVYMPADVLIYAECAAGLTAMLIFHYVGHNQVYFGIAALAPAPLIAFRFIEDLEEKQSVSGSGGRSLKIITAVMAFTMLFTGISLASFYSRRIDDAVKKADPHRVPGKYLSISRSEYEAMRWMDKNTDRDIVAANDRYYSTNPEKYRYDDRWANRFFLYEVYSNRFSYLSASGYDLNKSGLSLRRERIENIKRLYDPDFEERGDLARGLGIDYVIVSKRFTGEPELENTDYEKVFTNEDIDIYKILQDVQKGETE